MRLPRYPKYKGSEIAWLGTIPSGWSIAQLKHLLDIQNGADHKHVQQAEGYPVLGSGGVFAYASDYLYDGESVLLGRKGTIDKPLHVTGRFWTVDTMFWTKIRDGVSGRFAYYVATVIPFAVYSTNTALPSMTQGALKAHKVACPGLPEQIAIAAFLDHETAKIDALVAEQQRLIELLKEKRQAVISHAVTKGLNPDVEMKESGMNWVGHIPKHWEVRRLRDLARLESGHTPSRQHPEYWVDTECVTPWFTLADVSYLRDPRNWLIEGTSQKISRLGMENSAARLLPKGTVLLSRTASVGFSGIADIDLAVSQDFAAWICGPALRPNYLLFCLRAMKQEFRRLMVGATHQTIYMPDIKVFRLALPPLSEQAEICNRVLAKTMQIDTLTAAAERAIELLQERRTALISAAVTGQIDVRSAAERNAA